MTRMAHKIASLLLMAFSCPAHVAGQPSASDQGPPVIATCKATPPNTPLFNGFFIHEENDSLPFAGGDQGYTQGLRVSVTQDPEAHPCWVQGARRWRLPWRGDNAFTSTLSYSLGQGLYTPRLITLATPEPGDRGFSDFNYLGASLSLTDSLETLRYTAEVSVGVLGAPGLATATQGGLHALKLHRVPKGWPTTSPGSVGGFGLYTRTQLEKKWERDFPKLPLEVDLVVGPALEVGTVRLAAAAHGTLRVGWGLSGFGPTTIPPGAAGALRSRVEVGALVGLEGRAVAHADLVWAAPGTDGFKLRHGVRDVRRGVFARWDDLRISYLRVDRSAEFSVGGKSRRHRFGSVAVGFEPSGMEAPQLKGWLLSNWSAELGMGRNFDGPTLDSGTPGGVTAQVGVRKGIWKGLTVGAEAVVVTAEALATSLTASVRPDVIIRQQLATLGWGRDFIWGHVGLRGGTAWMSKARIETMLHAVVDGKLEEMPLDREYRAGPGGWMAGIQYFAPLERRMSVGVDVSRHSVRVDDPMPGVMAPAFWKAVALIRVRRTPSP